MSPYFKLILSLQLSFLSAVGQIPNSRYFISKSGFCSTSLFLDSLGNFYQESGCEGRSHISFGTYKLKAEKIDFVFQRFDSLPPIYELRSGRSSNDLFITVTLLTRQGRPISNNYFSVDAIDTSGKFFKTLKVTDNGQIIVDFKKYKELRLNYLENIYRRKIRVPITNKDMAVILNLPQLFFNYSNPSPEKGSNFSLVLKKDGLYAINGKERVFSLDE